MSDSKTLDKIRAILRKASDSNPSEAEREVAMELANRLLIRHGLSMEDVGDLEDGNSAGRTFQKPERVFTTESEFETWKGHLLHRLGSVYFCKVYRTSIANHNNRWYIVGRQDYVQMVQTMYDFVMPQIEAELVDALSRMTQNHRYARVYASQSVMESYGFDAASEMLTEMTDDELAAFGKQTFEKKRTFDGPEDAVLDIMAKTGLAKSYSEEVRAFIRKEKIAPVFTENVGVWRRSFVDSATSKVASRLRKMVRDEVDRQQTEQVDHEPGTDLIKNEKAALDAFMDTLDLGLTTSSSERKSEYSGHLAGAAAGERADLSGHNKVGSVGPKELGS